MGGVKIYILVKYSSQCQMPSSDRKYKKLEMKSLFPKGARSIFDQI